MTPAERRQEIVTLIRQRGRITVDELAARLDISRETIRRDLTRLAQSGLVQKFHGGASLPLTTGEAPFRARMSDHALEKARIAVKAATLISPGETVFVDTGSTTVYFAEELAKVGNLTVITNSAEIARIMDKSGAGCRAFMLGGEFHSGNRQTAGPMAIAQARLFRAHHCVLTIGALDVRTGVMDFNIEEAQVARAMIEQAESLTILVDSSKFGAIASFEVCPLSRIGNLVCDARPDPELMAALEKNGVRVHLATA